MLRSQFVLKSIRSYVNLYSFWSIHTQFPVNSMVTNCLPLVADLFIYFAMKEIP